MFRLNNKANNKLIKRQAVQGSALEFRQVNRFRKVQISNRVREIVPEFRRNTKIRFWLFFSICPLEGNLNIYFKKTVVTIEIFFY